MSENPQSKAFVYFLTCADGTLYCGWTTDLDARVAKHNSGKGAKYTRARRPVWVACAWEVDSADARRIEYKLKQLSREEKLSVIENGLDFLSLA